MEKVFVIQFENDTSEEIVVDDGAYKTFESAEKQLFEYGYEKKLNWADRPFYEHESNLRYANILTLNLKN